jgi:cob(I)alamin adenosyltransferase
MNKSLYHISTEAKELVSALEENEGELNPAIESALRINQNELTEKSFSYAWVVKSELDDISIAKEEIKRLQGIIKAKEKVVERMKEAVVNAMSIYGIEKLSSPTLTLSISR